MTDIALGQLYSSSRQSFLANTPPFTMGDGGICEPGGNEHINSYDDIDDTTHTMPMKPAVNAVVICQYTNLHLRAYTSWVLHGLCSCSASVYTDSIPNCTV